MNKFKKSNLGVNGSCMSRKSFSRIISYIDICYMLFYSRISFYYYSYMKPDIFSSVPK